MLAIIRPFDITKLNIILSKSHKHNDLGAVVFVRLRVQVYRVFCDAALHGLLLNIGLCLHSGLLKF